MLRTILNKSCKIYRCREIRNTDDYPLFRYETFINFLTFSFSTLGERDTIFTMLTVPTSPTVTPGWTGPARPKVKSQLTAFSKITKFSAHRFRAWRHSHPSNISYLWFLLWHLWLSYLLRACVNCTQCVGAPAPALSRIVHNPTKPNDKI